MDKLVTGESTKKQSISLEKKNMAIRARKKEEVLPPHPCISYLGGERNCESQVFREKRNAQEVEYLTETQTFILKSVHWSNYRVGSMKGFFTTEID